MNRSPAVPDSVERELLRAVRDGDDYLFGELVARYSRLVLSTALRLTGNRADAEEVAQEVFLRVHRKIGSYDPTRPFVPWLYKITLRVAYTRLSQRIRGARRSIEEMQPRFDSEGMLVPEALMVVPDIESRLATSEVASLAEEMIAGLPEEYGTVVWMHDVAGIPAASLREVLRLSLPALKSRLHRGRLAVRRGLLEALEPPTPASRPGIRKKPWNASAATRPGDGVTCREVVESLLADYVQDRLEAEDHDRFERHLRLCDGCHAVVASYRQVVRGLSRMPEPAFPSELTHATLSFLRESLEKGRYLNRDWASGLSAAVGRGLRGLRRGRDSLSSLPTGPPASPPVLRRSG